MSVSLRLVSLRHMSMCTWVCAHEYVPNIHPFRSRHYSRHSFVQDSFSCVTRLLVRRDLSHQQTSDLRQQTSWLVCRRDLFVHLTWLASLVCSVWHHSDMWLRCVRHESLIYVAQLASAAQRDSLVDTNFIDINTWQTWINAGQRYRLRYRQHTATNRNMLQHTAT